MILQKQSLLLSGLTLTIASVMVSTILPLDSYDINIQCNCLNDGVEFKFDNMEPANSHLDSFPLRHHPAQTEKRRSVGGKGQMGVEVFILRLIFK